MGIVWACGKFQLYLLGLKFELLTDHKPPESIFNPRHRTSGRIEIWALRLHPFLFTMRHISGKDNPTNILSRMPLQTLVERTRIKTEEYINQIINYSLPSAIEFRAIEVKEFTEIDPVLQRVIKVINENNWSDAEIPAAFKQIKEEFTVAYSETYKSKHAH